MLGRILRHRLLSDERGNASVNGEAVLGACLLLGICTCIPAFLASSSQTAQTFRNQVSTLGGKAGGQGSSNVSVGTNGESWEMSYEGTRKLCVAGSSDCDWTGSSQGQVGK